MVVTTFCTYLPYNKIFKNVILTMDFAVDNPWKMVPAHKCYMEQCCAILIGIGAKSVLKSKIFDTFGIVSVLVLKEVCNRYWYWSRYCKKSLRGIGIGIGIET